MRGGACFAVPPSPSHEWRGSPSIRRADHGGSARFELLRSGQANPIQSNPIQGSHASALSPHTSPLSTGWRGWGGGTIRRHGWRLMSPHGRVHGGSRHPTHGVPPRIELECSLCLCLCLRRSASGVRRSAWRRSRPPRHLPPQPAEHPPRYTQAIASPPGPLKPSNINGLKGKSAP